MRTFFSISLAFSLVSSLQAVTTVTTTIKPSGQGGDYTTLSAWEAGQQADLPALDQIRVGEIDGDWSGGPDTTAVTIDGWTTDSTRYIEIRTTTAARHTGKWDATKYVLSATNSAGILAVRENFVTTAGIQLQFSTTSAQSANNYAFTSSTLDAGAVINIMSCIAKGVIAADSGNFIRAGFRLSDADAVFNVVNCAAFNFTAGSANQTSGFQSVAGNVNWSNCTACNSQVGFDRAGGTAISINCLAQSCINGFNGTFTTSKNNCSDIASDAPGTDPQTGTITFTDADAGDFGLVAGVAIANGADLSATFIDDLAGLTRTVPWDIGARKYVSATTQPIVYVDIFDRP